MACYVNAIRPASNHIKCHILSSPATRTLAASPDSQRSNGVEADDGTCSTCPQTSARFSRPKEGRKARPVPDTQNREPVSWFEIQYLVRQLAHQVKKGKFDCILAISTGGIIPAKLLAEELGIDDIRIVPVKEVQTAHGDPPRFDENLRYLVVDDICDTGATSEKVSSILEGVKFQFAFCISRYADHPGITGRVLNHDRWIVFPWEKGRA